jgi:hypothetical protein
VDGTNLFRSFQGNPVTLADRRGSQSGPEEEVTEADRQKLEQLEREAAGVPPDDAALDRGLEAEAEKVSDLERRKAELKRLITQAATDAESAARGEPDWGAIKEANARGEELTARLKELEGQIEASKKVLKGFPETTAKPAEQIAEEAAAAAEAELHAETVARAQAEALEEAEAKGEAMAELEMSEKDLAETRVEKSGKGAKILAGTKDFALKSLKFTSRVLSIGGAHEEAKKSWDEAKLNREAAYLYTFVGAFVAGEVDDIALFSVAGPMVLDSWEREGSGPTQIFVGKVIRKANEKYEELQMATPWPLGNRR